MQDENDARGLIREAYRIEGIDLSQCRSIFLDWALGVPLGNDMVAMIKALLAKYEPDFPDHPMTDVLRDGAQGKAHPPSRKGGRKARGQSH